MSDLDEIVTDFLVESREGLDQLDADLLALEKDPRSQVLIGSIFRTVHTIKGTCGFLGFSSLERLSHVGENLLSRLRDGALPWTPAIANSLLRMVDAVRVMLASIETSGSEGLVDNSALIAELTALQQAEPAAAAAPAAVQAPAVVSPPAPTAAPARSAPAAATVAAAAARQESPAVAPPEPLLEPHSAPAAPDVAETEQTAVVPSAQVGDLLVRAGYATTADIEHARRRQLAGDTRPLGTILVSMGVATEEDVELLVEQARHHAQGAGATIRVDVQVLDSLMNLVGELVLARNQILQHMHSLEDQALLATAQRLNLVTYELQESVMKTRMQQIGTVWGKLPRLVRDLAQSCQKQVEVLTFGAETELDKSIVEAIKDPLTHIVRNSVDHGIERPEERLAAGKPATGRLELRAYHESGRVNIVVTDDGRGLNAAKIKARAIERGLISVDAAAALSDRELVNLIFMPGFSTAEKVTNISGRGVGMDVVRTNIEKIGGTLDVSSSPGAGMRIEIRIPLTLAIVPALIVEGRGERFAIPQLSLVELLRVEGEQIATRVELVHGAPIYRLRGKLLPLVDLAELLALPPRPLGPDGTPQALHIAVLQTEGTQFGLLVDEVSDTEEIVVKPLSRQLKSLHLFAGATIMGDGQVALILDIHGLAEAGQVLAPEPPKARSAAAQGGVATEGESSYLIVRVGGDRLVTVRSNDVARLEEFRSEQVERSAGQPVVQYRGEIVPLVDVAACLGLDCARAPDAAQPVMMVGSGSELAGLAVEEIVDIVQEEVVLKPSGPGRFTAGRAVVQGKVIDLLDVPALVATVLAPAR